MQKEIVELIKCKKNEQLTKLLNSKNIHYYNIEEKALIYKTAVIYENLKAIEILYFDVYDSKNNHVKDPLLLKYMIRKGYKLNKNILNDYKESYSEYKKLDIYKSEFLKVIINNFIFDNTFILNLLLFYKEHTPLSKLKLQSIIINEISKIDYSPESILNEFKVVFDACESEMDTLVIKLTCWYKYMENNILFETFHNYYKDEIESYLIEQKDNINVESIRGCTPLIISCLMNRETMAKYLIDNGVDVNSEINGTYCEDYPWGFRKYPLEKRRGNTPLTIATYQNNLYLVKYLIKNGAKIDHKDYNGNTAIFIAYYHKKYEIFKYLFHQGANIYLTERYGNIYSEKYLLNIACKENNELIVTYLIDHGVDINKSDIKGETPLIISCRKLNTFLAKYLIDHGANINKKNKKGNTPLITACFHNNESMVEYLRDHGADLQLENENGYNALTISCKYNKNTKIINYLIDHGVDVNKINKYGESPLMITCRKGHENIVRCLIEHRADVNKPNNHGDTPLIIACRKGHVNIVRFLVDKGGANINVKNNLGYTPLKYAIHKGYDKIIDYLKEHDPVES